MDHRQDVFLPKNLRSEDRQFFIPQASSLPVPAKKDLKDVAVTASGICLKGWSILPTSIHGFKEWKWHFRMYAWYQKIRRKSVKVSDSYKYFIIHNHWCPGYYHWVTEALPRLWMVKDQLKDSILLLPEGYPEFVYASLKPFKELQIEYLTPQTLTQVPQLTLPLNKPTCHFYYPQYLEELRAFYWAHSATFTQSEETLTPKRIYITRQNASRRRFENEQEIQHLLKKYDFEILDFENYPFWEQVRLMQHAEVLVSVHGGALTNIHFLPSEAKVLELIREIKQPKDHHSLVYWNLCSALSIDYYYQFCTPTDPKSSFYEGDLRVDLAQLEKNLELLIA